MTTTTWELNLKGNAATAAKRAHREVAALVKALRDLKDVAGPASKALAGVGGGDTSRRLRQQVNLIREQTRALKEQRATQAQRVRDDRATDRQRRVETKQQLDAHRAVARLNAQRAAAQRRQDALQASAARRQESESRRAEARAMGGRTRMDVAAPSRMGGRTRMDFAAGAAGRTRAEGVSERDIARGVAFQQRARALQVRHNARVAAQEQRAAQATARANDRQQRVDSRNNQSYFQRLSRMRQQSFRENERLRATQRRTEQQRQRSLDRTPGFGSLLAAGGRGAGVVVSGMMSIVSATLSAVVAIAGLAAGFAGLSLLIGGALLRMISFRESTVMTLQTLMRVPGEAGMSPAQQRAARGTAARDEFRWASQFARETPLDTQQVVGLRRQAATSGYQGEEARRMTSAAADAGALRPDDPTAGSRFILQMGQLRNSSRARSADYRPATQAAGVNEQAAMRRAAIAAGVVQRSGEADPAYQRRVDQAQGNGQITGRQMHDAILAEQNAQLGNQQHGDFARSQSGSLAATLSNLGEGFQAFVTSIEDIEALPGIVALKAMLRDVAATLAGTTNNGKALQAIFAGLVNDSAMFIGTIFGEGGFDGALSSAMETAKEVWPIIRAMASEFRGGFMEGFGPFLSELRQAASMARGDGQGLIQWARDFGRSLGIIATFMLRLTILVGQGWGLLIADFGRLAVHVEDVGGAINRFKASMLGMMNPLTRLRTILEGLSTLPGFGGLRPTVDALRSAEAFFGIGQQMGDGVAAGFRSRQAFMQGEISSVMASLPATARTDMQIKSPSRVMAEIGQYMAEGVTVGLDSGAGGVQSAMSSVVAPPSLPGMGGALGGMGAPSISIVVQVRGGASAEETGATIGERIEEILLGTFGRMQLTGGA